MLALALATLQQHSAHVPVRDGTRIAVDVYLPEGRAPGARVPALLELTRYGRAREDARTGAPLSELGPLERHFLAHDYAIVKVDVRGTGASFGTRPSEYGREEVRDGRDVVAWVVAQDWCDGNVGAYGTSYSGTTAELLAAAGHPAVKAVVIGWSDFDSYRSPIWPYGMYAESLSKEWSALVAGLDRNDVSDGTSVRRVLGDTDGALLRAAVAEHSKNPDVHTVARAAEFRDQKAGSDTWAETSAIHWKKEIEASKAAMLVFASWFDSGTAEGALLRFQHFSNPQSLVILASDHGGGTHASPFAVSRSVVPARPSYAEQMELRRLFFDRWLKGADNESARWPKIRYWNLGEEALRSCEVWPPPGVERVRFFLAPEGRLTPELPAAASEVRHAVDFGVTTGKANRWGTQMGRPVLALDQREEMDERMLVFDTEPLEEELQITGTPVVTLRLAADVTDCAVLAYLEAVDLDGRSRYLTEGGLRLVHRKLDPAPDLPDGLPQHSFESGDALALVAGETVELTFRLHPLAVRLEPGHALRLALAGADSGSLERCPASGAVNWTLTLGGTSAAHLEIPVEPSR
jgi:putative CocE/NonD family hydrolase